MRRKMKGDAVPTLCHKCNEPMNGPLREGSFFVFACLKCQSVRTYTTVPQVANEHWTKARIGPSISESLWKKIATRAEKLPRMKEARLYLEVVEE